MNTGNTAGNETAIENKSLNSVNILGLHGLCKYKIPIIHKMLTCGLVKGQLGLKKKLERHFLRGFSQPKFCNNWLSIHCIGNAFTVWAILCFWIGVCFYLQIPTVRM